MADTFECPDLKRLVGALIFGANRPLDVPEIRRCLMEVADLADSAAVYMDVKPAQIREAVGDLQRDLQRAGCGFNLAEVAGGYRVQSDPLCGRWLRHLLKAKPQRLSRPALETLAIIAHRQPVSRADLESVRGVTVSHVIKALMETRLVRIVGRSELPGRPLLYGTTQLFLEHFGLKDLSDLNKLTPTVLMRREGLSVAAGEPFQPELLTDEGAGTETSEDGETDAVADGCDDDETDAVADGPDEDDAGGRDGDAG